MKQSALSSPDGEVEAEPPVFRVLGVEPARGVEAELHNKQAAPGPRPGGLRA